MVDNTKQAVFLNSPIGWLKITANATALTSIEFISEPPKVLGEITYPHLKDAYRQLGEYFRGDRMCFNLPIAPEGTDFQKNVWRELTKIPFGSTVSYKELAQRTGLPKGARAIGMANNKNPLPIIVPCHRVIGADGNLIGYAGGLDTKRKLLEIEGLGCDQ